MLRWKDKVISEIDRDKFFKNSGAYFLLGLSVIAMTFFGICSPRGSWDCRAVLRAGFGCLNLVIPSLSLILQKL